MNNLILFACGYQFFKENKLMSKLLVGSGSKMDMGDHIADC